MLAREAAGVTSSTSVMGLLVWFSIIGVSERDAHGKRFTQPLWVNTDDLARWFSELELDPLYLPTKINAVNAFRSASSKISAEYDLPVAGQRARLVVEEVRADNEQIIRHINREVVDSRRIKTASDKVAELRFNRGRRNASGRISGSESLTVHPRYTMPEYDKEILNAELAKFVERYEHQSSFRDDDDVRTILREYLRGLDAVAIEPSKGIYFVGLEHADILDRLAGLVSLVGPACALRQLPLMDCFEAQQMVADAFDEQLEDEVRILLRDVARCLQGIGKSGSIAPTKYSEFSNRYGKIKERRDSMSRELNTTPIRGDQALSEARTLIAELVQRVDPAKRRR